MKTINQLSEIYGGSNVRSNEDLINIIMRLEDPNTGELAIAQILENKELCELIKDPKSFRSGYQYFAQIAPLLFGLEITI